MRAVISADRRRRDELVRRISQVDSVTDVFRAVSSRLGRIVPFDAAGWMAVDPGTSLPIGPTHIDGLPTITAAQCSAHWRREFIEDDVVRFSSLLRAERPAAALRAVAGDPMRSRRYREFVRPLGMDDELRAVLRVGDTAWGTATLFRRAGRPAFSTRDVDVVASLSAPIGEAVRTRVRPADGLGGLVRSDVPGMMLFDLGGDLVSVNDQAGAWLAELPPSVEQPTDLGVAVPLWLMILVSRAASAAHGVGDGTARARVQSRRGPWLVCHATYLSRLDGGGRTVAVVIEPAKTAEIAPIVIEAYDLSEREQQITRLIARGAGTGEIAGELHLSAHTVRDHVKAIFAKVEVSSRGELVAKLFAEFYEPVHMAEGEMAEGRHLRP
jgi:DNA-binding CsgD family transcriptional regulator